MGHTAVIQRSQRTIQKVGALVEHAWRRHLAAAAQRRLSGFLRDLPEAPLAVGFCDSVLAAARIALELAEAFGRDNPVPPVRVGVAYGPALARAGEVLGPVVNLASRCTTLARPGAVLVDKALADALEQARADNPEEVDVTVHAVRAHRLRGFGRISTFRLRWAKKADGNGPG